MPRRRALQESPFRTRTFLGDTLAWLTLLILGSAGIWASYAWTHRDVLDRRPAAEGAPDPRIAVLAYDRVVERPDGRHVDREQFRQQLAALAGQGFKPVTLEALRRFYRDEGTLPPRSVLLTFDHGYLSTLDAVDPVLREWKWPAVMFVMTERQERRDPFFLYWPGLKLMVDSGIWEIGSHGHQGHNPVPIDAEGTEGPFFVRRAWLAGSGREESWQEFGERVVEDHRRARELIQNRLGRTPLAYAPPLRDIAVASLDPEVHRTYEDTLRDLYALAFVDDLFGMNDRTSDRLHLKRLRVGAAVSAEELGERIAHALGSAPLPPGADERLQRLWVAGTGKAQPQGPVLVASGPARADLWRASSQWSEDWVLEADAQIDAGQLWVVQQSADLSEEWRWGGDENRTHLQRRRPAQPVETLASFPTRIEPGRFHHLKVVRRGTGVWVEWDGEPVSDRPAYLPERWRGNVGLVTWGGGQPARLQLSNLHFSETPYRVQPMSNRPSEQEVQAAIREAPSLSALSPSWLQLSEDGLEAWPLDSDLLTILARRYGWEIVPTLSVRPGGETHIAGWLPRALARAKEAGWAGLRLDLSALPRAARDAAGLHAAVTREAEKQGLRLVLDLDVPSPEQRVADGARP